MSDRNLFFSTSSDFFWAVEFLVKAVSLFRMVRFHHCGLEALRKNSLRNRSD
jgi:hypothetical protein